MKIYGTAYFFTPLEKDFDKRDDLREHLARPTAGRLFLKKTENEQWTIPFGSITHLISILNEVRQKEPEDLDFTVDDKNKIYEETFNVKERRCMRIRIEDDDPQNNVLRYAQYAGDKQVKKRKDSDFTEKSTGVLTQLDLDEGDKFYKVYFTDFFDAGIKLDRMFTVEVRRRILTYEQYVEALTIPYDVED